MAIDEPGILALDSAADLTVFLEPLTVAASGRMVFGPSREILTRIEPGAYSLRWAVPDESEESCGTSVSLYPICGLRSADDHGDDFACASDIVLGSETPGLVSATDADLFSFLLASRATVVVETSGEADTYLTLFDAGGRSLMADDDGGAGRGSRIEAELSPGRYFLSIEGVGDSEGSYVLIAAMGLF